MFISNFSSNSSKLLERELKILKIIKAKNQKSFDSRPVISMNHYKKAYGWDLGLPFPAIWQTRHWQALLPKYTEVKLHARKPGDGKYEERLRKVEDEVRKKKKKVEQRKCKCYWTDFMKRELMNECVIQKAIHLRRNSPVLTISCLLWLDGKSMSSLHYYALIICIY